MIWSDISGGLRTCLVGATLGLFHCKTLKNWCFSRLRAER